MNIFTASELLAHRLIMDGFLAPKCLGCGTDMHTGGRDMSYAKGSKELTKDEANEWLKMISSDFVVTNVRERTENDGTTWVRIFINYAKCDGMNDENYIALTNASNKSPSKDIVESVCDDDVIEVEYDLPTATIENKELVIDYIKEDAIRYLKNHGVYETLTVNMIYDIINALEKRLKNIYDVRITNVPQKNGHLCLLYTVFLRSGARTEFTLQVEPISSKPKIYFQMINEN